MRKTILAIAIVMFGCGLVFGQPKEKLLWSFGGPPNDGAMPFANLVSDESGNLFGTTSAGGNSTASLCDSGCGTIFELSPNPDGTWQESILYNFCTVFSDGRCQDGALPLAGLVQDQAGNLYGTTSGGGSEFCPVQLTGCGTVFELSPPHGAGVWTESILHNFCSDYANSLCLDGAVPTAQLTFDTVGNMYGTTGNGGSANVGTVFELSLNSGVWTEMVLYNFCSTGHGFICPDGEYPLAGITFDALGNIYGTTEVGGSLKNQGGGTVYELIRGESGWTETVLLHSAKPYPGGRLPIGTVSFDANGNLYSTAQGGGLAPGWGSVFRLSPQGDTKYFLFDEVDGFYPSAGLLVDSNRNAIFGTTIGGGGDGSGHGTVFRMRGGTHTVLYTFCAHLPCTDGIQPHSSLIEDKAGNLYGTTQYGGADMSICQRNGCGTVFEITP